jgi:hypothetical protein
MSMTRMLGLLFLGALVLSGCRDREGEQRTALAHEEIRTITTAAEKFRGAEPDKCPTVSELQWHGDLSKDTSPKDPWGTSYYLSCAGPKVRVKSAGPDGREGTADDIQEP